MWVLSGEILRVTCMDLKCVIRRQNRYHLVEDNTCSIKFLEKHILIGLNNAIGLFIRHCLLQLRYLYCLPPTITLYDEVPCIAKENMITFYAQHSALLFPTNLPQFEQWCSTSWHDGQMKGIQKKGKQNNSNMITLINVHCVNVTEENIYIIMRQYERGVKNKKYKQLHIMWT